MSSINVISPDKFARLLGTPHRPALIDVRSGSEFAADPNLIPGAIRHDRAAALDGSAALTRHQAVVVCQDGGQPVTALRRSCGPPAR